MSNNRDAQALRDIVWDQIDILRDKEKSRQYDMKRGDQILKAAGTIIDTWKVELAAKALVMKGTPPAESPPAEPPKEIEHANGEKVVEGDERAGEAGEAGKAQAAVPSGKPEVETAAS